MTSLARCLDRTLLLMRDEFGDEIETSVLLDALTSTSIALVADASNLSSHSAQSAFVAAALLMARSGHEVFLIAPDVEILYAQPPLQPGRLVEQLAIVGKDLLPEIEFKIGYPNQIVDLAIAFGDTPLNVPARRGICLNADPWAGFILRMDQSSRWRAVLWPFGGLAAGALGACEAFKIAMMKLLPHAKNPASTKELFAPICEQEFRLAPEDAPHCIELGQLDIVSGGAIANSILYCLARVPEVAGTGRIIEPDIADDTNLNRNMLLLRSGCEALKAHGLASMLCECIRLEPVAERYDLNFSLNHNPLARTVAVGVDDIPTRWAVQRVNPELIFIGATTHWSAMASFHSDGLGCAECLHNRNHVVEGPVPTMACVSFWAGLLTATYLVRFAAGEAVSAGEQQVFMTPFRPENPFIAGVAKRKDCPTCRQVSVGAGAIVAA